MGLSNIEAQSNDHQKKVYVRNVAIRITLASHSNPIFLAENDLTDAKV